MPFFSKRSAERLATCVPELQLVMNEAILEYDFTVLCGHRGKEDQDKAVEEGKSQTPWPTSKHNSMPSMAADIAPWPVDWNDIQRFKDLAQVVLDVAARNGIDIVWGGHWKSFKDYPHYQIGG